MTILSHGNGTPADEAAVRQLQADVAIMRGDIADIKQSLVLFHPILERMEHIIDQGDRLIEATAGPDGVPAWQAAIGALGGVTARLAAIEAALAGLAQWAGALDGRLSQVAQETTVSGRLVRVALALIGASKAIRFIAWLRR